MCWMALAPLAIGVVGGMMKGNAAEDAADRQAAELRRNAGYAQDAADDARARGRKDSDLQRIRTSQMIGTQRAAGAASGGDVNQGSNAIMQEDTAMLGEFDALTIENNAAREAYGYEVQATEGLINARQAKLNGAQAKRDSILGGILGGAGGSFSMLGGAGGAMSLFGGGSAAGSAGTYGSTGVAVNTSGYRAGVGSGR